MIVTGYGLEVYTDSVDLRPTMDIQEEVGGDKGLLLHMQLPQP